VLERCLDEQQNLENMFNVLTVASCKSMRFLRWMF
jgi:hypothetical protein